LNATFNELRTEYENNERLLKTCKTGNVYTVDITDIGRGGDGIARIRGFVIFLKHAKVEGKVVKIKINSVGDRFATAEIAVAGSTDTP
jgi:predicted RNA-binding protein with TRAM domain